MIDFCCDDNMSMTKAVQFLQFVTICFRLLVAGGSFNEVANEVAG